MGDIVRAAALGFWNTLSAMAPYLLFGFLMAGVLSVLVSPRTIERHLGSRGLASVLKAALFGVPLPLCSCGVIPVAASLRKHGASQGATTAFLLSTPQTGVDSILVTFAILGPVFAVFRPLVALVSGIAGGLVADAADGRKGAERTSPTRCEDACCSPGVQDGWFFRAVKYGFIRLPRDIGKPLLAGVLVAGLLSAAVPQDFFAEYLGGKSLGGQVASMSVMMLVGLPMYVCATASVPLALALIRMGVSPGAALVFLMTGPATNAAAIATILKVMGKRTTAIYLGTVAVTALGAGLFLNYIDPVAASTELAGRTMLPTWVATVSAVALLGVLGGAILGPFFTRPAVSTGAIEVDGKNQVVMLAVSGMTCGHCAAAVERVLRESEGVESAGVDLKSGRAVVTGKGLDTESLIAAIEELGYSAEPTVSSAGCPDET